MDVYLGNQFGIDTHAYGMFGVKNTYFSNLSTSCKPALYDDTEVGKYLALY
jgi:hypothetical protein